MDKLCHLGILCIDPGFNTGCTVVSLDERRPKPVFIDVVRTEKCNRKVRLLQADDDQRRLTEIWNFLDDIAKRVDKVVAVFAESTSAGKSSRAVAAMGFNKGLIGCFSLYLGVPLFYASAQAVKKAATGHNSASKEEVQDAMIRRVPHLPWSGFNKGDLEHAADSCAIFLACWNIPELQAMLRIVR